MSTAERALRRASAAWPGQRCPGHDPAPPVDQERSGRRRRRCRRARSATMTSRFASPWRVCRFCLLLGGAVRDQRRSRRSPRIACIRASASGRWRPASCEPRRGCAWRWVASLVGLALCVAVRPLLVARGRGLRGADASVTPGSGGTCWCSTSSRSLAGSCSARSPVASPPRSTLSRWFVLVVSFAAAIRGRRRSATPSFMRTRAAAGRGRAVLALLHPRWPAGGAGWQRCCARCSPIACGRSIFLTSTASRGGR